MLLVRTVINALTLLFISILPDIYFVEPTILSVLFLAVILGVLNAFVKPIIQFLTLRFIFITYGFAIVIINAIILWLLSVVLSNMFVVDRIIWTLLAGALFGLVSSFFENLLGLQIPIVPDAVGLLPAPAGDRAVAFESRLFSGVIGESEELAAEESLGIEAIEDGSEEEMVSPGEEK